MNVLTCFGKVNEPEDVKVSLPGGTARRDTAEFDREPLGLAEAAVPLSRITAIVTTQAVIAARPLRVSQIDRMPSNTVHPAVVFDYQSLLAVTLQPFTST